METFCEHMTHFVEMFKDSNSNCQYSWQYMHMVGVLLLFISARGDGIWDLNLYLFGQMLPCFQRYDHANYARWGVIYLAQKSASGGSPCRFSRATDCNASLTRWRISMRMYNFDIRGKFAKNDTIGQENY